MKKRNRNRMEQKFFSGSVTEVKLVEENGVEIGVVEGYIATWDLDRGNGWYQDQFVKGAFSKSIRDLKRRDRPLRLKDHHGRTIGGFPPTTLKEDSKGLFGIGHINLEVQQGLEAYKLAKQGVLSDFSVGFSVVKSNRDEQGNIRTITEALLWEGSIVDEPMNPEAVIMNVKENEHDNQEEEAVTEEEAKSMTRRNLEEALRSGREFTKQAAKVIASLFDGAAPPETEEEKAERLKKEQEEEQLQKSLESVLDAINGVKNSLKE